MGYAVLLPANSEERSDSHVCMDRTKSWNDPYFSRSACHCHRSRALSDPAEETGKKFLRRGLRALRKCGLLPPSAITEGLHHVSNNA